MTRKLTRLLTCLCMLGSLLLNGKLWAQQSVSAKGIVRNEKNEPVEGATVTVENKSANFLNATETNVNGEFVFYNLAPGGPYNFTVTHTGYENKALTGYTYQSGQPINLEIQITGSSSQLSDVVVVGYGTQKKANLTGAVGQVDAKAMRDRPVANASQALQGRVPGMNVNFGDGRPGSGGNLNIRGFGTLNRGSISTPLVLVDGVPGNINLINPRDIENISVLKDASSAAIYGARAAFGVVLVTTKTAKKGKTTVSYSNNFSWQTPTVSTDFMTDGYDVAMMMDEGFTRATGNSYTRYTDEDYAELKKRQTDKSLPSVVIDNRNGKDMYIYYGNTDWWNTMFRDKMPSMQHTISVAGGSEKVDYYISGRYYNQKGMMRINQDEYNLFNFRAKINAKVTPWLTLYTNTQFNTDRYEYPGWGWNSNFVSITVHALPSYVPVNPDGTATYRTELNNYTIGDGIYADLLYGKSKGVIANYNLQNTIGGVIKVTKDFDITANYTYELNPAGDGNTHEWTRRTRAPWSIYPGVISYVGLDRYIEFLRLGQYHVINAYGTYQKTIQRHNMKLIAGYNQEFRSSKLIRGERSDLLSEDLNDLNLGTGTNLASGGASEWALMGFFGRINYDFDGKYLLELNGRYDGTSRFPKGNRFGFFPSVAAGWRISSEKFFEPLAGVVSDLKFRGSYGSLGNQLTSSPYPTTEVMGSGQNNWIIDGGRTQYLSAPTPLSPVLTWETTTSTNVGVDLGLFRNRLTASFDLYRRTTKDMLTNGPTLSAVFGASSPPQNVGELVTKGFELSINWQQNNKVAGKDFYWSIGGVLADYTSKITSFFNPTWRLTDYYAGRSAGAIWGYITDGYFVSDEEAAKWGQDKVAQSLVYRQIRSSPGEWNRLRAGDLKFKDLNGDSIINNGANTLLDPGDMRIIGDSLPRYSFGITGSVAWNNFDLSFFIQGIGRKHWYPGNNSDKFWGPYSRSYYSFTPVDFRDKIWSPENPNAYFPRLRSYEALNDGGTLRQPTDRYLQDLAYVRLKNISIGYTLPAKIMSRFGFTNCRFYVTGENLITFTKFDTKYIDPEMAATEVNGRVYPFMKSYAFGLDLSF
jgi:TonB-linked outer membrane protein, SusC/RagA family